MQAPLFKILGGACKGLCLRLPPKSTTRPTKAIVRESFFNVLGVQIQGSCFIEAFGGSGSVGLEALSRGAGQVLFFEQDPLVFEVLQKNIRLCMARLDPSNARACLGDCLVLLATYLQRLEPKSLLILYLDPPFKESYYAACWEFLERLEISKGVLEHGFLVVFEHQSTYKMPRNSASFSIIKQRKFGKTSLSYYIFDQRNADGG